MKLKNITNSKTIEKVLGERKGFWKYARWECPKCKSSFLVLQDGPIRPKQCLCGNKKLNKKCNLYFAKENTPYLLRLEKKDE